MKLLPRHFYYLVVDGGGWMKVKVDMQTDLTKCVVNYELGEDSTIVEVAATARNKTQQCWPGAQNWTF